MRVAVPHLRAIAALAAALAVAGCGANAQPNPAPKRDSAAKPRVPGVKPRATANGVALTADPEAEKSFPLPEGTPAFKKPPLPGDAPAAQVRKVPKGDQASEISPGAPSDAQIRRELKEMAQALKEFRRAQRNPLAHVRAAVTSAGRAQTPIGAPDVIDQVIAGGNAIAKFPYIWGGGHGSFVDNGYDCSGSVSYALAAAGLLDTPLVSGDFAKWGAPGPGRWITIYANAGHVFMYVAGLRFDTSGRDGPFGSRWQTAPRSLAGFEVRHPPGL
jgi:cell wall-associated NlpC family hydrolase